MVADRIINPAHWSVNTEGCGKRRSSVECSSGSSVGRTPFATEADRSSPPPQNQSSGGKGKAPSSIDGGYAGVKASRLAEIRETDNLPSAPQKQRVDCKNSVSDARAAEDSRFFQAEHKVGRKMQQGDQKYYTDPKACEQYRYYIANTKDGIDGCKIPGTKRHSKPQVQEMEAAKPPYYTEDKAHFQGPHRRPASSCGSDMSQGSATSGLHGRPRSATSVRSKSGVSMRSRSSVRSSAASERSYGGYSSSAIEPVPRNNPFQQRQGSICDSRTSEVSSEISCRSSQTSRALSAHNLKRYSRGKDAPSARPCSSAATSASGWSQMSSQVASSLRSDYVN